jgi:glucose-1-phosphate adenylyltransferase
MGNYVFNTGFLYEQVIRDADEPHTQHDFGRNIIPNIINNYRVFAFPFRDAGTEGKAYWRDVGTLDAYWQANMELVSVSPQLDLYDNVWPILTHQSQSPPAKFVFDDDKRRGQAIDSMVSGGCIVSGSLVKRSLLFSDCFLHSYSDIRDSVILPGVNVGRHCRIRKAIVDRGAVIDDHTVIGEDHDEDRKRGFRVTPSGIVLVTPEMLGQRLHFTR